MALDEKYEPANLLGQVQVWPSRIDNSVQQHRCWRLWQSGARGSEVSNYCSAEALELVHAYERRYSLL